MEQYIPKSVLVAEIEKRIKATNNDIKIGAIESLVVSKTLNSLRSFLDTLEVKEVDVSSISENLAEAHSYLDYTHTSNLAHNKPMIAARLRKAIKELHSVGLFQLTHDEKYRMENLGLKAQK